MTYKVNDVVDLRYLFSTIGAEDRSGRDNSDLDQVTREVRKSPTEKTKVAGLLKRLDLDKMPGEEVARCVDFIYLGEIPPQELIRVYSEMLRSRKFDSLRGRAEILRFVAKYRKSRETEIEGETRVKRYYPWHWIDAMESVAGIESVEGEIENRVVKEKSVQNLLVRMPSFFDKNKNDARRILQEIYERTKRRIPRRQSNLFREELRGLSQSGK